MQHERQAHIRELLTLEGELKVEELADRLKVTSMTIRRDLTQMEQEGILLRVHGACRIQAPMVRELSFSEKDSLHAAEKCAIAHEVANRIKDGMSVFLDTGTTTLHVARLLPRHRKLQVFTNNLRVAMELFGCEGIEVNVLGGKLASKSPDLVGELGIAHMHAFRVDLAIAGTDAVDVARGEFFSADIPTALFSRAAQERAEQCYLVTDASKFGRRGLAMVGKLRDGITIFTDSALAVQSRKTIQKTGAELHIVQTP